MVPRHSVRPKSKFEPFEDALLLDIVSRLGASNWSEIAAYIQGRNARQCRERWTNYVNPNLAKNEWTEAEDEILLQTYQEIGPKWFVITGLLPGRGKNSVKNRYFLLQHRAFNEQGRRSNPPANEASAPAPAGEDIQEILPNGADPFAFLNPFHEQDGFEWDFGDTPGPFWN
jgi:hypothetical protein